MARIHFDTKHKIKDDDRAGIESELPNEKIVKRGDVGCNDWLRVVKEYDDWYVVQNMGQKNQ